MEQSTKITSQIITISNLVFFRSLPNIGKFGEKIKHEKCQYELDDTCADCGNCDCTCTGPANADFFKTLTSVDSVISDKD